MIRALRIRIELYLNLRKRALARPARREAAIQGQRTYWAEQRARDPLMQGRGR